MVTAVADLERRRIAELATAYAAKGYQVFVDPQDDQLPEQLAQYRPDMLVRRGDETIIVEVKSRRALRKTEQTERLKRLIATMPGWRVELVVVNPEPDGQREEGQQALQPSEARSGLEEAEKLLEAGHPEAAMLLGWASTEAVLRLVAERSTIRLRNADPTYLIKALATDGAIGREDYHRLFDTLQVRNALAHGYKLRKLDRSQVTGLLKLGRGLLDAI